jgi:hypothetical protein
MCFFVYIFVIQIAWFLKITLFSCQKHPFSYQKYTFSYEKHTYTVKPLINTHFPIKNTHFQCKIVQLLSKSPQIVEFSIKNNHFLCKIVEFTITNTSKTPIFLSKTPIFLSKPPKKQANSTGLYPRALPLPSADPGGSVTATGGPRGVEYA